MMKLTIIRERWARGGMGGISMLRNGRGNQCCLGFLGETCGVGDDGMRSAVPYHPTYEPMHASFPTWLFEEDKRRNGVLIKHTLMSINDNLGISEEDREVSLTAVFARHGVEVEFV